MKLIANTSEIQNIKTELLIIPVVAGQKQRPLQVLDKCFDGYISHALSVGPLDNEYNKSRLVVLPQGGAAERALLIHVNEKTIDARSYRQLCREAYKVVKQQNVKHAASLMHDISVKGKDTAWKVSAAVVDAFNAAYHLEEFKSKPVRWSVEELGFVATAKNKKSIQKALSQGQAIGSGMQLTRYVSDLPPNVCTPRYLAKQAQQIAEQDQKKFMLDVLDEQAMREHGMGAFLGVSQGSDEEGQLIVLQYNGGRKKDAPVVFVGKGITFDSGGYCLKTPAGMLEMKYDMGGAATVLGVLQACYELKLNINVVGIIAAAENMVSGCATRTGDIVKTAAGLTVEITNTDAEGRLVLCDALHYARALNPKSLISVATLTGAAIITFGHETTALMSNHQPLANKLLSSSEKAAEYTWQLPLFPEYMQLLKSEVADMMNSSLSREAGTIVSASFLSRFTEGMSWAHLDIAGTSISGKPAQSTGRPVEALVQYLLDLK